MTLAISIRIGHKENNACQTGPYPPLTARFCVTHGFETGGIRLKKGITKKLIYGFFSGIGLVLTLSRLLPQPF